MIARRFDKRGYIRGCDAARGVDGAYRRCRRRKFLENGYEAAGEYRFSNLIGKSARDSDSRLRSRNSRVGTIHGETRLDTHRLPIGMEAPFVSGVEALECNDIMIRKRGE